MVKIDYGFSCGRHWIKIDGKMIAQTPGDDVWMKDEDVCDLARAIVPGCIWEKAYRLTDDYPEMDRFVGVELQKDIEAMRQALRDAGYVTSWHHDMWIHPDDPKAFRRDLPFDEFRGSRETHKAYQELKIRKQK